MKIRTGTIGIDPRDEIESWKQHYDEHLNGAETEDQEGRRNDYISTADEGNVPSPTISEVKAAIKQLKNNKAAGKDGIGAELIKLGPDKLATCLHKLIVRIWETERLPEDWKEGIICPVE